MISSNAAEIIVVICLLITILFIKGMNRKEEKRNIEQILRLSSICMELEAKLKDKQEKLNELESIILEQKPSEATRKEPEKEDQLDFLFKEETTHD